MLTKNNNVTKTVIFAGDYEKIIDNGLMRGLYYISGGDGLAAVYVKTGSSYNMYYAHTDHLGSIVSLTDGNGNPVFKATYDAWGKQDTTINTIGFHRGYTGHEHLDKFGLINMNGRMYDPMVGRFLSPDPYVQAPDFSQSFNRYSYCLNNPLIYTDPDGEIWQLLIGGVINVLFNWNNIDGNLGKGLSYFAVGAMSGMVGGWAAKASSLYGFIPGAIAGGLSSGASNLLLSGGNNLIEGEKFFNNWKQNLVSGTVSGAILGGIQGYKKAQAIGFNPWTGNGMVSQGQESLNSYIEGTPCFSNDAEMNQYIKDKGINLGADFHVGKASMYESPQVEYFRISDGRLFSMATYNIYDGVTVWKGRWGFVNTEIYVAPFSSLKRFTAVFNHELIHAYLFMGPGVPVARTIQESIAYAYSYSIGHATLYQVLQWNHGIPWLVPGLNMPRKLLPFP